MRSFFSSKKKDDTAGQSGGGETSYTGAVTSSEYTNEYNNAGNMDAPLLSGSITGGHVTQDDGSVAMGRPVGGGTAAIEGAASVAEEDRVAAVTGRVLGVGPPRPTAPQASQGGTKIVACSSCGTRSTAATNEHLVKCDGCQKMMRAGETPAMHVQCYSCQSVNLVAPGVTRIKCGTCATLLDIPGEEADLQRALAASREEDELKRALQASIMEQ